MINLPHGLVGTQYGVCRIFEEMFGHEARWIDPIDWHVWSGNVWQDGAIDTVRGMVRKCGETIGERAREIRDEMDGDLGEGSDAGREKKRLGTEGKAWAAWGKECQQSYYQDGVLKQLRGMDSLKTPFEQTIRNPLLINTRSGVVDLEEPGNLHRHKTIRGESGLWPGENSQTSSFHCRQIIPLLLPGTDYLSESLSELALDTAESWEDRCPQFYRFIHQTCLDRVGLVESLRQALGYSMTGLTHERTLFVCYGSGANGKSVLMGLFRRLMGSYATSIPASVLAKNNSAFSNSDRETSISLAQLVGKRLVVSSEYEAGDYLPEAMIKSMTGGEDEIIGRAAYHNPVTYNPQFKIWLMTNHKPSLTTASDSIRARLKLIPFDNVVPGERQDIRLPEKLWAEASQICLWAMTGWIRAQAENNGRIDWCQEVRDATGDYLEEQDIIKQFVRDCLDIIMGRNTSSKEMYATYACWAKNNGYKPLAQRNFSMRMKESNKVIAGVKIDGRMTFKNVSIRPDVSNLPNRYGYPHDDDKIDQDDEPY